MILHISVLLVCATVPLCASEDVVVTTKNGALRGRRVSTGQTSYMDTFLGIPFAAPPVGSHRFSAPQPAKTWTGTRAATSFGNMCPQPVDPTTPSILPVSEDCLNLNVYAPNPPSNTSLLPVMFWIYGGAYTTGTAAFYNGTELASKGVVVVTTNYRLGALGFLSTQDSVCPGNNGLRDQILALKWVKDNIASFHGDPNDVTIFGESAGSGSVALLRLSPLAQGLFSKAIMESGASLSPWAVARPGKDTISPLQFAQSLGNETGCSDSDLQSSADLVSCLQNVTVDTILNATKSIYESTLLIKFRPTVETVLGVVPDDPLKLLTQGAGSNIPSIWGVNKNEYSLFLLSFPLSVFTLNNTVARIFQLAKEFFPEESQIVASKIIAKYIPSKNATHEQYREALEQINTDFDFIVPTIREQQQTMRTPGHAQQYLYEFTYRATHSTQPDWAGVMHASELPFVFGQPFTRDQFFAYNYPFNWTAQDMNVSMNMVTMWTNFAKHGNPTPQSEGGVSWPPYSLDSESYLDIGSSLSVKANLKADRVKFWTSIMKSCLPNEFQCNMSHCIDVIKRCDLTPDCEDESDEQDCETYQCPSTHIKCKNHFCVPRDLTCDFTDDCGDNSDEANCDPRECFSTEFKCDNKECIAMTYVCDGEKDCKDGSDELRENCGCLPNEFQCNMSHCIDVIKRCDLTPDCEDESDEQDCETYQCPSTHIKCKNHFCVPRDLTCDFTDDCGDNSDEANCDPRECFSTEFKCDNKECIAMTYVCDGEKDCKDGSDELRENCGCLPNEFQCNMSHCIDVIKRCDLTPDCEDESDEQDCETYQCPSTHIKCKNHFCVPRDLTCDFTDDCGDNSDEANCGDTSSGHAPQQGIFQIATLLLFLHIYYFIF